jgi:hypothetical protein
MPEISTELRFMRQGEDQGTVYLVATRTVVGEPLTMVSTSDREWALLGRPEFVTLTLQAAEE